MAFKNKLNKKLETSEKLEKLTSFFNLSFLNSTRKHKAE